MTHSEKLAEIIKNILEGNSVHVIRAAIAEQWADESNPDELIAAARQAIKAAGGMKSEAQRHIYNQLMQIGDYSGALRALEKIDAAILEGQNHEQPPVDATSSTLMAADPPAGSLLAEILAEIDLSTPPEEQPPPEDFVPKAKRLPNMGQTSKEELQFRHSQVAQWISLSKHKSEVKKLAYAAWGIKARTFENYYTAAYKILAAKAETTPDEQFQQSVRFYEHVIANDATEYKDKISARKALDELLGIQKPRKTSQVGANGQVIDPVSGGNVVNLTLAIGQMSGLPEEDLKKLSAAYEVYESVSKGGVTNGNSNASAGH